MLPEPGTTELSFASFIILLGVVQGFLLTAIYLFQRTRQGTYTGLFFLAATLTITEIFLNRTGYMYHVIWLVDFSEPLQFLMAPLGYLLVRSLNPGDKIKHLWLHFLPFIVYFLLFLPFYLAPAEYKLASYYFTHHQVAWPAIHPYPLLYKIGNLRHYQLQICVLQISIYIVQSIQLLLKYKSDVNLSRNIKAEIRWLFIFTGLLIILVLTIVTVKLSFERDLGDHFIAAFITLIIYVDMIRELGKTMTPAKKEPIASERKEVKAAPDPRKAAAYSKINELLGEHKFYTDSLISVAKLGKLIGEPSYLVSQVINEHFNMTFYDWIAFQRIDEAKRLLKDPSTKNFTIEDIAERVGYNSKSAFNKAFKKFAGNTPSEYRTNV
ncbi:MAG TPA: helix-turn-helix domain-containing protein [Bacteroidales bacterium]|nr:helix-turn-helix domain-containing protein [Bacteroidales bacterium]